jgi:hypothetical protein
MREMKGGAVNFRMFEVHFGKMNGDDDLTQPEFRNANTLIGTLCYYPKDGDFYFCVYDSATSHVTMISIFHAICRLCGIDPTSETTANLIIPFKKKLNEETHPFHGFESKGTYLLNGLKYADGELVPGSFGNADEVEYVRTDGVHPIGACFVLKKSLVGKPQLSFIRYTRYHRGLIINENYENVQICTIPKMPAKLSEDDVIKLPSEQRNDETLGLVLVDLQITDESFDSRKFGFADYSLPVKAAMKARKMIDSHLGPVPSVVPGPPVVTGSTLNTTDGMVS